MLAARRIPRCRACSVTLLNSLFSAVCGAGVRLPVPARALTTATTTANITTSGRLGLPRGIHCTAAARNAPPPDDWIVDEVVETVTDTVGAVTELFDSKETGEVGGTVVESVVSQVGVERRTTIKEEEDTTTKETVQIEVTEETQANAGQSLPWFLRVETPRPAAHPFAERQAPPALPPAPPPALAPLLTHISVELGISDLAIMDLRSMDPPPAIGPDTIMVIGNARSERHLHTSADRLCRWLRSSEWRMKPEADGLLGRGELKVRNRRLKKKGKLVNTQTGAEDGVGWICVNAGDQGLVVQLFTRHRRDEIDLEGLWGKYLGEGAITRSPRAKWEEEVVEGEDNRQEEGAPDSAAEVRYTPNAPIIRLGAGLSNGSDYPSSSSSSSFSTRPQRRLFHTAPPRRSPAALTPSDPTNPRSTYLIDDTPFKGIEVPRSVSQGKHWHLTKQLPPTYTPATHPTTSELILRAHINHLKTQYPGHNANGSRSGPCTLLGTHPADTTSTPFLQSFRAHLPTPRTPRAHQLALELLIEAHRISPTAYPADALIDALAAIPTPPQELHYLVLRALSESPALRARLPSGAPPPDPTAYLDRVLAMLARQHPDASPAAPEYTLCWLRALAPRALPLVAALAKTVCTPTAHAATHAVSKRSAKLAMGSYRLDKRVHELDAAVREAPPPHVYTLREYYEMLLTTYAMCGAWRAFWNVWGRMRYLCVRRDEGMFALVVGLVVMGGRQREAVVAGRRLVEEMGREVPAVVVGGGLAKGLRAVVELAEGGRAEGEAVAAQGVKERKGEWAVLREKCERVLRREGLL